jgi:aldose 1-epimerase
VPFSTILILIMIAYIGDVLVNVTYHLSDDNSIDLTFKALTTKPSPINLANHVYFNLGANF